MKQTKRILAIIGIVILAGLYITALVLAIVNNENTTKWFTAAIVATVVVPIMIYVYQWLYKAVKKSADESRSGSYIRPDEDNSTDNNGDDQ